MDPQSLIRDFIVQELNYGGDDELTGEYRLLDKGVIDSLGIFQVVTFLEEQFDVSIADDELVPENFETIDAIAKLVESKR